MSNAQSVGVAIVNYKTAELVKDCLTSLSYELVHLPNLKVIVVDNDSPDDSFSELSLFVKDNNWRSWIEVVSSGNNGGFAFGNNVAIKPFMNQNKDYIWLLNPDTFITEKAGLSLVEFLETNSQSGIAGSHQQDENGNTLVSAFNYPSVFGEFIGALKLGVLDKIFKSKVISNHEPVNHKSYDWMSGASLMVRREVFENVGIMDEKYFLYFEEVDFCFKVKKHGYSINYVKDSCISHYVGASTNITDVKRPKPKFWFDSRRRYFVKNHGRILAALADINHLLGLSFYRLKQKIKGTEDDTPPEYFKDFIKYSSIIYKQD